MKNKLFRKLSVLALSLVLVLSFTACVPDIHIHTSGENQNSSKNNETVVSENALASSEEKVENQKEDADLAPQTSAASSEKQSSSKKENSTASKKPSASTSSSSAKISKADAKSIALKDAGVKASDIYDYEIELDYEKGVEIYDISFEKDGKDYDYEINAKTGKIISVDKPKATSSEAKISKSKAKSTALNHAGVKAADISRYQIELEKDDGIWKYEISFNVGNVEYDYTINAENGKILESEKDIDD